MSIQLLPPCQHRGESTGEDLWSCDSPRLILPLGVVHGDTCRFRCPYVTPPETDSPQHGGATAGAVIPVASAHYRIDLPATFARIAVGVTVTYRDPPTLGQCLASLAVAGFHRVRVFGDNRFEVSPDDRRRCAEVIQRATRLGAWQHYVQTVRDLLELEPDADSILVVQDDAIFCRNVANLLARTRPQPDTGVLVLGTARLYESNGRGIVALTRSQAMDLRGAWALLFPREAARELVEHDLATTWQGWANRRIERVEDRKGIDTFVGRVMLGLGLTCYAFVPSLVDHVGVSTLGHGLPTGNRAAASFPGETADACGIHGVGGANDGVVATSPGTDRAYEIQKRKWLAAGGHAGSAFAHSCWEVIRRYLQPGMRTLEFGSGLSTCMFSHYGCDHTAVEHDPLWHQRLVSLSPGPRCRVQLARLTGTPPWYDWQPGGEYDLVFVDGPQGRIGRQGFLRVVRDLGSPTIVFDDTLRSAERELAEEVADLLGVSVRHFDVGRGVSVVQAPRRTVHFVTAAYGETYHRFARGLINSFERHVPRARLTVYADADLPVPSSRVRVDRSISRAEATRWNAQFHPPDRFNWIKLAVIRDQFQRNGGEVCWIDCDQLILDDLRQYLRHGRANCVRYGFGENLRNCGNGLLVPQKDYVIGGLFSLPSVEDVDHLIRLGKQRHAWQRPSAGQDTRLCDQVVLNHYVRTKSVAYFNDTGAVFDMAPWNGHPLPTSCFADVIFQDGAYWIGDKKVVVPCLMSYLLDAYLQNGFAAIKDSRTRKELTSLYSVK